MFWKYYNYGFRLAKKTAKLYNYITNDDKEVSTLKKIVALSLILALCVALFAVPTSAEGEIFVASGNTVIPLTDAMPIRSNGVWYVDYQVFTKGDHKVNSSYSSVDRKLVLYTWDTTLIFDLNNTTAYTAAERIPYKAVSFLSNGTVYVPVQFAAQMLGFEVSYISEVSLIRIKKSTDIPDSMFKYIAKDAIPNILKAYNDKKNTQQAVEENSKISIKLSFNITNASTLKKILDELYRYGTRATFFVSPSQITDCQNELRRAVALGHTLGILTSDPESIDETNDLLFDIAKVKTRLVRIPNGTQSISSDIVNSFISKGMRLWDQTFSPSGSTSNGVYNSTVSQLKKASNGAVFTFSDGSATTSALSRILRYFSTNKVTATSLTVLDTPVNKISEKR